MALGQAEAANPMLSPGDDGNGTGVPGSSVIQNVTNLANAVAVDVAGVYRTVNSPPPQTSQTFTGQGVRQTGFSIGLVPLLLIGLAAWLIFK